MNLSEWEVLPPRSRNWDADEVYEDEIDTKPVYEPLFMWSPSVLEHVEKVAFNANNNAEHVLSTKVLLIGTTGAAACFLHSQFPAKKVVGSLSLPEISMKNNTLEPSNVNNQTCYFFEIDGSSVKEIMLVICQYEVTRERSYAWTSTLFRHVRAERVVVLERLLDSAYRAPESISSPMSPLLRKIETTVERKLQPEVPVVCAYLEPPNLIERMPAAVLTHCEHRALRATLFLSLEDSRLLDLSTLLAFESVLGTLGLKFHSSADAKTIKERYLTALEKLSTRKHNPLFI